MGCDWTNFMSHNWSMIYMTIVSMRYEELEIWCKIRFAKHIWQETTQKRQLFGNPFMWSSPGLCRTKHGINRRTGTELTGETILTKIRPKINIDQTWTGGSGKFFQKHPRIGLNSRGAPIRNGYFLCNHYIHTFMYIYNIYKQIRRYATCVSKFTYVYIVFFDIFWHLYGLSAYIYIYSICICMYIYIYIFVDSI